MIPVIQVRTLAAKKSYEGRLAFCFVPEDGLLDIPYTEFAAPVSAELHYAILEDNSVEVEGTVTFTLKGLCSRCLEEAEQSFSGDVFGVFVEGEGDGETYGYRNGAVDLTELLKDAVLFAIPSRLLCGRCAEEEDL